MRIFHLALAFTLSLSVACDPKGDLSCQPADELCNDADDDCDGAIDEGVGETYYADIDGDGWGAELLASCDAPPDKPTQGGDCADEDASVWPGAEDVWYDGVDADCDGWSDYDQDHDGEDHWDYGGTDCRDRAPEVGATRCENLLIVQNGTLSEITPAGDVVNARDIVDPTTGELTGGAGVVMDDWGNIHVYNTYPIRGSFLSTLSADFETWTHILIDGDRDAAGVGSYGQLGVDAEHIWVPDIHNAGGAPGGLYRFEISTGTLTYLVVDGSYGNAHVGPDGLLYAQVASTGEDIDVFDPATGALLWQIDLPFEDDVRSFAIDQAGGIWSADWNDALVAYDSAGVETQRFDFAPDVRDLESIAIDARGRIAIGARFGELILGQIGDESFEIIDTDPFSQEAKVAWVAPSR